MLTRLIQVIEVGEDALATLAFLTAEDQLQSAMLALAECGIQLFRQQGFLRFLLGLQFGDGGVQADDILIQVFKGGAGVA